MLGYVKVDKPEMKVRDYEVYRALYCYLCKAMARYYGIFASFTLSYDVTFLLLMRLSFSNKHPGFKRSFCVVNPTKRCNSCVNQEDELRYAASISMILFYYKVKDNIKDSPLYKRFLMYLILPWARLKYNKAKKLYPDIADEITECMKRQGEKEKSNTDISDKAAHESADALGKIMSFDMGSETSDIYRFGYGVGKWVYLIDAADDIERDIKDNSFNVFVNKYSLESAEDITEAMRKDIIGTLNLSCAMAVEAYDKIENKALTPIAENILILGMNQAMEMLMKGKQKK